MNDRSTHVVAAFAAVVITLAGCASNAADTASSDQPATASVASVPSDSFLCGDFGSESIPSLIGLDEATGRQRWTICGEQTEPPHVVGRSTGVTVLQQPVGPDQSEAFAIDDTGVELWRHPSSGSAPRFTIGVSTLVTDDGAVVAIDVLTGEQRWSHPVDEGVPIAAARGLVIEIVGGPYPAATTSEPPPAVKATVRAVDEITGGVAWSRDVQIVPVSAPSEYSPTVGDAVVAVPSGPGAGTEIIDAASGDELREEPGLLWALRGVLVEVETTGYSAVAISDAVSGTRFAAVPYGTPLPESVDTEHLVPGTDILFDSTNFAVSRFRTFQLVDTASGTARLTLVQTSVMARSADHVVVGGRSVQLLDSATGKVLWDYGAPVDNVGFAGAALGDGVVIVVPASEGPRDAPIETTAPTSSSLVPAPTPTGATVNGVQSDAVFTATCCRFTPTGNSSEQLAMSSCGLAGASGEIHNTVEFTSSYILDVDFTSQPTSGDPTTVTNSIELSDVVGGETRSWTVDPPAGIADLGSEASISCTTRAARYKSTVIDPAVGVRAAFEAQATALCTNSTAPPGQRQTLIAALRQLPMASFDQAELSQAFDQWLAFENAVKSTGSIAAVAAADPAVLQGAFTAHQVLSEHVPACAFMLPNGE